MSLFDLEVSLCSELVSFFKSSFVSVRDHWLVCAEMDTESGVVSSQELSSWSQPSAPAGCDAVCDGMCKAMTLRKKEKGLKAYRDNIMTMSTEKKNNIIYYRYIVIL